MRILYVDIDSLRPDHLGCYGYHRDTSPNIDQLAREATRFDNVYISDAPCLPSRTALWSGRNGFHTGVVNHAGTAAVPFVEGASRRVRDVFGLTGWMNLLREAGLRTVSVSSFADRHSAWHWYAGFDEFYNPGGRGLEPADQVTPYALDWLGRNGLKDNWFLHVNLWDPHTPYRTPASFGNPFENDPIPEWMTEEVRLRGWNGYGPHSPQEPRGYAPDTSGKYPLEPTQLDSMAAVKQWFDGYDLGIRYADHHVGLLFDALTDLGVMDDTIIIIGADHGENHGELNVWGDHQTADQITCRVPLIVCWPGITDSGRVDSALHYHFDWAATLVELVGGGVPDNWDGQPFTAAFREGRDEGRAYLVTSQGAWSVQRGVRFRAEGHDYICLRTYHNGYKMLDPVMLFDLTDDPHEQYNLSDDRPDLVNQAMGLLAEWLHEMMATSDTNVDPLMTVLREGGPFYTQGQLGLYVERLRATGRGHHAVTLLARHPDEV